MDSGNVNTDTTYILGTNSYEGNQYWAYDNIWEYGDIEYENITNVFRLTNGYEEGEPAVARRYSRYIPPEKQDQVVDKYYDTWKNILNFPTKELMTSYQSKLIAGFIYGDLGFRLPAYEQAKVYAQANANVYAYYINTDFPMDMILRRPSPYGTGHGAGHGLFGSSR